MKVVHLQISRVTSQNDENEPIYDTHVIKLEEGYSFSNYLKQLPVLGLVKSKTMVVKVVEIKGKDQKEIDKEPYQKIVTEAMNAQKQPVQGDLSLQLEAEKKRNEELENRLKALEEMLSKPAKVSEKEQLIADYIAKHGKEPDRRWSVEMLKLELNK
jgi:hypothetical protein